VKGARVSRLETKSRSEKTTFSYEDRPARKRKTQCVAGRMTARESPATEPVFCRIGAFWDRSHALAAIGVS
jgi:hypothetical protein